MTAAGWFVMSFAVLGITGLLLWCLWKVVSIPESTTHLHSPADIDPDDD